MPYFVAMTKRSVSKDLLNLTIESQIEAGVSESEIRRIARVGFEIARKRQKRLCSVDKANVLDTSIFWREVVTAVGRDYPDVRLSHMYVDNAAMQLVRNPRQFDVIVTGNLFGDILSDLIAELIGGMGIAPSGNINPETRRGLFEPVHGTAPDIAGRGLVNPIGAILSASMMVRHLGNPEMADAIEGAVRSAIRAGECTRDLGGNLSTGECGDAVARRLKD